MFARCSRTSGIEVHTRDGSHPILVVGSEPEGVTAAFPDALFQVGDEGATYALITKIRARDERMQLPHVTVVGDDAADPSEDRAALVDGCPADPPLPEGFPYLFEGSVRVRPGIWPVLLESLDQESRRLSGSYFVRGVEIDDSHE
jgi:hypothetical protein